jgi:drug/metabolite transporter (DMT)-like permease
MIDGGSGSSKKRASGTGSVSSAKRERNFSFTSTTRVSLVEGNEFDKELLFVCGVYTIAAGSEYWLLDWLKLNFQIELPIFFALVQNASFPLQGLYYLHEKRKYALEHDGEERVIDAQKYKSYCILGSLNAVVTLSRTIGLTSLPPTIYAIIANTEIVFEGLMTRFYLGRKLTVYQILSIVFVVTAVLLSMWDPANSTFGAEGESSAGKADSSKIRLGISISLLSRFTSSINTILADRFLGRDRKTRIGVYECAFFNAIIPFAVIWFALLFSAEATTWASQLTGKSTMNTFTITCVVTMICFAKWGDRISKFSVVQKASTMLFAIVDANMKFIAVIGTLVFFRQQVTIGQLFGFAFIFLSLCCSLYDKKLKVAEDQRKEQLKLEKEAAEEQEGGLRESELSVISTNTNNTLDKKTTRSLSVTHKMSFMGEGTNEEGGVHGTKNPMQTEMAAPSSEGEI